MADNRKVIQTGVLHAIIDKSHAQYPSKSAIIKFQSGNYEAALSFEFKGDKMNLLDGLSMGDTVEITGYVSGRTYADKNGELACYNSLSATEVARQTKSGGGVKANEDFTGGKAPQDARPVSTAQDDSDDSLPF